MGKKGPGLHTEALVWIFDLLVPGGTRYLGSVDSSLVRSPLNGQSADVTSRFGAGMFVVQCRRPAGGTAVVQSALLVIWRCYASYGQGATVAGADVYSLIPSAVAPQKRSTGRPSQPQRPPGVSMQNGLCAGTTHLPLLSQPDGNPQR